MAKVFIPAQWRDLTGGRDRAEVAGETLRQIVGELEVQFPGFAARLLADDRIAPGLAVSIDGVMNQRGLSARIAPQSEIHILPALGGG